VTETAALSMRIVRIATSSTTSSRTWSLIAAAGFAAFQTSALPNASRTLVSPAMMSRVASINPSVYSTISDELSRQIER